MRHARRIDRAREELKRVKVEARRVHTSVRDEEVLFRKTLSALKASQDPIYGAAELYCARRRGMNARSMAYILHLYQHPGFDGETTPGKRAGCDVAPDAQVPDVPQEEAEAVAKEVDEEVELGDDDLANEEFAGVLEFLAGLTV